MCITFIKLSPKEKLKFIIGFNREVELTKPTRQAGFWPDDQNILGGLDLALGGACLAINVKTGHIAILTNYSELPREELYKLNKNSRGDIVRNWVQSNFYDINNWPPEIASQKYMEKVLSERSQYNPFNLIVGKVNDPELKFFGLDFMSNIIEELPHNKFIGMSNSSFKCPYPKLSKGLEYLNNEVSLANDPKQKLNKLLQNRDNYMAGSRYDPDDSVFVNPYFAEYRLFIIGTISTTVICVDAENSFTLDEKFYTFPQIRTDQDQSVSSRRKLRRVFNKIKAINNIVKNQDYQTACLLTTVTGSIGVNK